MVGNPPASLLERNKTIHNHTNIPAVYLVLKRGNKVLLLMRYNTGYHDGHFSLVAGHVDQGESFTQAVIREAKEEAGIVIDPKYLQVVHVMHRKSDFDGSERVDVFFQARKWSGEITNCEPDKCSELSWFEIKNLPNNTVGAVRQGLQNIVEGIPYSERGWDETMV